MSKMPVQDAWTLVRKLTKAARAHQNKFRKGGAEEYLAAINVEVAAELQLMAALTGLDAESIPDWYEPATVTTGPDIYNADDERERARQVAFGMAVANFELPREEDDVEELAELVHNVA